MRITLSDIPFAAILADINFYDLFRLPSEEIMLRVLVILIGLVSKEVIFNAFEEYKSRKREQEKEREEIAKYRQLMLNQAQKEKEGN